LSKTRVLFLLKQRHAYGYDQDYDHGHGRYFSSGLYWSARFAQQLLRGEGFDARLVEVVDGNDIDREVSRFAPAITIIEALWVTPEKLAENARLHPAVKWIVRLHSETPFLALEGMAIDWIKQYWAIPQVFVSANSPRMRADLEAVRLSQVEFPVHIPLLPTFYPEEGVFCRRVDCGNAEELAVACPGAIRPFKNHLTQAIAAMRYASQRGLRLAFHVNRSRSEQGGDNVYKNLVALFDGTPHRLVGIPWLERPMFIQFLRSMDLGMQVSFTETFNIVAADMVTASLPIVVSPQIRWASNWSQADPTDSVGITAAISRALSWPHLQDLNERGLRRSAHMARRLWLEELHRI